MTEYEAFLRVEAERRGIHPDTAIIVANAEGGLTEPARRGTFATGSSWWAFQLHYGGAGYEHLGTIAGMGNEFTRVTGWKPGDPKAWRDAMRWALDRARSVGWGPWYGAKAQGVTGFYGIDRSVPWDGTPADEWDYQNGTKPMGLPYNPDAPCDVQPDQWSCALQSTQWLLRSIGRNPDASDPQGDPWLKSQLVPAIISPQVGLQDASGRQLAAWITREYGAEMGFVAHAADVTFDDVLAGAGVNPTLIGGRRWGPGGHWAGVRRVDDSGQLELANPSPGYTGVGTHLSREEWDARGPWSAVYVDRLAMGAADPPPPPPAPPAPTLAEVRAMLLELTAVPDEKILGRYFRDRLAAIVERIPG